MGGLFYFVTACCLAGKEQDFALRQKRPDLYSSFNAADSRHQHISDKSFRFEITSYRDPFFAALAA